MALWCTILLKLSLLLFSFENSEENAANILKAKLETKKRNIFLALSLAYLLIYFRN